jgi:hypothetical protein
MNIKIRWWHFLFEPPLLIRAATLSLISIDTYTNRDDDEEEEAEEEEYQ